MHLDISTPGLIGEIEGMRMRESHKNREWLRERSHWGIERDDRRTKVERKRRDNSNGGTKVLTRTQVAKHKCTEISNTLSLKEKNVFLHLNFSIEWTSITCFMTFYLFKHLITQGPHRTSLTLSHKREPQMKFFFRCRTTDKRLSFARNLELWEGVQ